MVNDKYLIWNSKIFYLFANPLGPGILDMEELEKVNDPSV